MSWFDESGSERRPLVFVEDHLYHTTDLLTALRAARPDLLSESVVAVLDRPGPDTHDAVNRTAVEFPEVRLAVPVPADLTNTATFSKWIARRLRPGGLLIQDVQLSTLPFIPVDRWWESIYLAATIRGMFPDRPPAVRFLSNKRGYGATFGGDMLDAGFDPRDVMEKSDLHATVVPSIGVLFDQRFPLEIEIRKGPRESFSETPRNDSRGRFPVSPADRREIDSAFDLVLWQLPHHFELAGKSVTEPGPVTLRAASPEIETWTALIRSRLAGDEGVPVLELGARVGPPEAERAELTNVAARHIHTVRSRLRSGSDIVTVRHAYRLDDRIRAGFVRPRVTFGVGAAPPNVTE